MFAAITRARKQIIFVEDTPKDAGALKDFLKEKLKIEADKIQLAGCGDDGTAEIKSAHAVVSDRIYLKNQET